LGCLDDRPTRADPFKKMGGVPTDLSGIHENPDEHFVGFEAHVAHETGVKMSAGDTAEIPDALGHGEERSGCGLRLVP
jgi:hypothetical protein